MNFREQLKGRLRNHQPNAGCPEATSVVVNRCDKCGDLRAKLAFGFCDETIRMASRGSPEGRFWLNPIPIKPKAPTTS
jgi:hypothetical protein